MTTTTLDAASPSLLVTNGTDGVGIDQARNLLHQLRVAERDIFQQAHVIDLDGVTTGYEQTTGFKAITVEATGRTLAVPTSTYRIHQYDDSLGAVAAQLIELADGDATIQAVGYRNWGAQAFIQVGLSTPIVVADDKVYPSVFFGSSHDGSLSTQCRLGAHRVFCLNQITGISKRWKQVWSIRHTANSEARLLDARTILNELLGATDDLREEMERLVRVAVTDRQFQSVLDTLNPVPVLRDGETEDDRGYRSRVSRWETRNTDLNHLWRDDERTAPWAGTAWGAVQVFNTWRQHYQTVRGANTNRSARPVAAIANLVSGTVATADRRVGEMVLTASAN